MDMFFFEWPNAVSEIIEIIEITKSGVNQSKLLLTLQNFTERRLFINYMVPNIQTTGVVLEQ